MVASDSASSCGPQPNDQPPPPTAHEPNPTLVMSSPLVPSGRVASAIVLLLWFHRRANRDAAGGPTISYRGRDGRTTRGVERLCIAVRPFDSKRRLRGASDLGPQASGERLLQALPEVRSPRPSPARSVKEARRNGLRSSGFLGDGRFDRPGSRHVGRRVAAGATSPSAAHPQARPARRAALHQASGIAPRPDAGSNSARKSADGGKDRARPEALL